MKDISSEYQHEQRRAPDTVTNWLQRLYYSLEHAEGVIDRSRQHRRCLERFCCKPRLPRQIREWNTNFDQLFKDLQCDFSSLRNGQEIVSLALLQAERLLHTVPDSGFVGLGIKLVEMQLNTLLDAEDHQFRGIGVYGMSGIGTPSLMKTVYHSRKKGNVFEKVIWLTVSQKFSILDLHSIIAHAISLDLSIIAEAISLNLRISSFESESSYAVPDLRKMRLSTHLKKMKFLLTLGDVWHPIQLEEELGIPFGSDKASRVVTSTRNKDLIRRMGANYYSIQIEPLSTEEGCQLFHRVALKAGDAPAKITEITARKIAEECKGLPLAINVVAAAMRGNTTSDEWHLALTQMENVDPEFLKMYSGIGEDFYGRLKWSYDRLNDCNLQNCFLFCCAFPEDAEIQVERLVEMEMWIGDGLINSRDKRHLMDAGRRYVKLLVERCFFEDVGRDHTSA